MNRTQTKRLRSALLPFAAILALPASAPAQQAAAAPSPATTISTSTNEVVLDVVARDKKGRDVKDLKQSDFQVTDNGDPVQIKSFRLVDRGSGVQPAAAPSQASMPHIEAARQLRLVTLVFQGLDENGRKLSRQAAMDLIKGNPEPNVYYSVFTIDQRLSALQPFTNDRDLLKKAIDKATAGSFTQFAAESQRIQHDLERMVGGQDMQNGHSLADQVNGMNNTGAGGTAGGSPGAGAANYLMAKMMLNMMQFEQNLAGQQVGRASVYSLLALVREQTSLPGRKALMYFTENYYVPQELVDMQKTIIGAANRSNVSVYAIDARGLGTGNLNEGGTSMLAGAASASKDQLMNRSAPVTNDEATVFDRAADSLQQNTQNSLAQLANETGGFLIANTNDFRAGLRKVAEDLNTYYEITYSPNIQQYDGSFRRIAVKVDQNDLKLQSRSGYFALPPSAGPNVLPYEMPLLAALDSPQPPHAFEFRTSTIHFRPGADKVRCALVLETPLKDITMREENNSVRLHLGVEALVKNGQGEVVQKFSQDVPLKYAADRKTDVLAGTFTFRRVFDVPPGRYTIEQVVADYEGNRASTRKSVLMASGDKGLGVSSLILVQKYQAQVPTTDLTDPFRYQNGQITPNLTNVIALGKGAVLSLYFVIYPDATIKEKPQLTISFLKDGAPLAQVPMELPAPDKEGRIPYVASIPVENLPAGEYVVQITAKQGGAQKQEQALFKLQ
jgi:VWFA-related protein